MKKLSALIVALSIFTPAGAALADATHCEHVGDNCITTETVSGGGLIEAEMTPQHPPHLPAQQQEGLPAEWPFFRMAPPKPSVWI